GLTTHGAPRAIGDHGAPVSLPKLKKAYEKGTRGTISWGPLLTPGPHDPLLPGGPMSCQSAPVCNISFCVLSLLTGECGNLF
ncbi:unnamed protein product, partial [Staurois parvus]